MRPRTPKLHEHGLTVSARLEPSYVRLLRRAADAEAISVSCLVRRIVHQHLDGLDAMQRVEAGCVSYSAAIEALGDDAEEIRLSSLAWRLGALYGEERTQWIDEAGAAAFTAPQDAGS